MTHEVTEPGAALLEALGRIAGDGPAVEGAVPFALGWATVESDRAERAFAEAFGPMAGPAVAAPADDLLGASCRIVALGVPDLPLVVLLEPDTEGRLAAILARYGEGPMAVWFKSAPPHAPTLRPSRPVGAAGHGPFGPQVLLSGAARGSYRFLVPAGPGTITP